MIQSKIYVPLLNANEPEARLVEVHVKDRQAVEKGTRLFTIETTKATSDIESPEEGFIHILSSQGEVLAVGDLLAVITDSASENPDIEENDEKHAPDGRKDSEKSHDSMTGGNLRITKPARALVEALGLDLSILPNDGLITEEVVRSYAGFKYDLSLPNSTKPFILVYGAGGHAKSVMEIVLQNKMYTVAGILDDKKDLIGKYVLGIPVLGTRVLLPILIEKGVTAAANGVGGILDIYIRVKVFELMENAGFSFPTLVHPNATVEPSAKLEEGVQVFANAYIGSEACLHKCSMVNTNAVVSHDCSIGAYSHIAPGALLAGHVQVGEFTLVGMGVTTAIGLRIGDRVRIGNGAILLADVPDKTIIQAGRFWTGKAV